MIDRTSRAPTDTTHSAEQRRLVETGLSLVERCATEIARRYRGLVCREELLAPGTIALHEAAHAYRSDLHPSFLHYARHHVHGRMIDAIRTDHYSLRARVERAFAGISAPATLDIGLFWGEDELSAEARRGCPDALAAAFLADVLGSQPAPPEDEIAAREACTEAMALLRDATAALEPHERVVVDLVYRKGMTMDEVGRALRVHPNTAQRRHIGALRRLRRALLSRE